MYQFFTTPDQIRKEEGIVTITGPDVNHMKNVLRMQPGEEIAVSNGSDGLEYRCRIASYEEDSVNLDLLFVREENVELPAKVYLFQGLPKADKMELIIQKAVELGVYEIIPVATDRAVVKLDQKKEKSKLERWNAISEAAAKQSKNPCRTAVFLKPCCRTRWQSNMSPGCWNGKRKLPYHWNLRYIRSRRSWHCTGQMHRYCRMPCAGSERKDKTWFR